ncbi:sensor histidine kinase [Azohydromonas caseinilytica]|uniref:sensor histidine kinase n=1 Tax=Azohydromonas caseinilytica TaxID=2728836 RepID=UPI0028736E17|nr:ATP-binding protein [Azohydromonas caseinilytica]
MKFRTLLAWSGACLALVAAAAWSGHRLAWRNGLEALQVEAQHRLELVTTGLDAQLARFDYLPSLLETTPQVMQLLRAPGDEALRHDVNATLRGINATAGADMLYVIGSSGRVLAAGDAGQPGSPLGLDLSFRPYVRDALAQRRGRFFGVGVSSGRPGYYLSFALAPKPAFEAPPPQPLGVATVKVSLETTEQAWRKLPGEVLALDEHGVVILGTREGWKYRPLQPLPAAVLQEAARTRSYGGAALKPLDWRVRETLPDPAARLLTLEGRRYLASERLLQRTPWRLVVLDDLAPLQAEARRMALTGALAGLLLPLLGFAWLQRRRALAQQRAGRLALQMAYDSLEARVVERTAELRAAQNELVHAGKMALLGRMSAGMVHELNQPLAAMRTLADNACVLLQHGRTADVEGNLQRIAKLVDRLGALTQRLKSFAHKSQQPAAPVALAPVVANAQFLLSRRLREAGVELEVDIDPPKLQVLADEARLEQVLVNLMANAIDALETPAAPAEAGGTPAPPRRLCVRARVEGACARIDVEDSGPGIREDILPRLFEPFVTSKPAGSGLGLGLMISAHIARESGGTLRAENRSEGGARFIFTLPLAQAGGAAAVAAPGEAASAASGARLP